MVVIMLIENAPPEPPTSAVGPPSPHHLCPLGGSVLLSDEESAKKGHATVGEASECEFRVLPAEKLKRGDDVVIILMEDAPPEPPTTAVGPPSPRHLCPLGGSLVPPDVESAKDGHATVGEASECELRVVPAKEFKSGDDIYAMVRSPRGMCIIINNNDFGGLAKEREGSELDVRRMKSLFEGLHFKCIVHCDLAASDMKKKLLEAAQSKEHEGADCLVVILMSHGNEGTILGTDMEKVYLDYDVYGLFNNEECPTLQRKPKLFFIQACRGKNNDNGTATIAHDTTDAGKIEPELPQSSPSTKPERMGTWSDMYFAYATRYGYEALKNSVTGSWFLSAVYEVFSEHAGTMHLGKLMERVHDEVLEMSTDDGERQTPVVETLGWKKELYFNPKKFLDSRPEKTVSNSAL